MVEEDIFHSVKTGTRVTMASDEEENTPSTGKSKHFHCYLLRSLDPSHPHKTYIGFTTNPQRRLRQHNGELKNGGARRTKRSGRPWQFVCLVHGFTDSKSALQFEWAWQHPGRSLRVRNAIGDAQAKKLSRKRGVKTVLEVVKTLLIECSGVFESHALDIYFLDEQWRDNFHEINTELGTSLPPPIHCKVISNVEDMPFWIDLSQRTKEERAPRKRAAREKNTSMATVFDSLCTEFDDDSFEPSLMTITTTITSGELLAMEKASLVTKWQSKSRPAKMNSCEITSDFDALCLAFDAETMTTATTTHCSLCHQATGGGWMTCILCFKTFHDICIELELDDDFNEGYVLSEDWTCPSCSKCIACSESTVDRSEISYRANHSFQAEGVPSFEHSYDDDHEILAFDADNDDDMNTATPASDWEDDPFFAAAAIKGVHTQSITKKTVETISVMSCDSSQSPELIDLTESPSIVDEPRYATPMFDGMALIDLSQSLWPKINGS